MSDQAYAGPQRRYQLGATTLARYGWRLWEASRHGLGSSARTPWGAVIRQRRWEREYRNAPPGTFAMEEGK